MRFCSRALVLHRFLQAAATRDVLVLMAALAARPVTAHVTRIAPALAANKQFDICDVNEFSSAIDE